ncbi:MAG TPA: LysR family transcriptional regulator [Terriglobales bacterium]|nr:LysR family transcriptional regulator [Terriglobales bacterium]
MINFNHLRLFQAAAEAGNVSRAAERLRLSQPAVSKQIRELEEHLGCALLERQPRGVRPTAAGELLAAYARQIFAVSEGAERALADLRGLRRGRLRIGASMTIGVYLVPPWLAECRRRWPGLELECTLGNTDRIQQALIEHRLDLGLTEGPGQREEPLASRIFRWDELVLVASPEAFASPPRSLAQAARLPWVMRERGSGTRAVVEAALARHGLRVTPAWTLNNAEAVKQAVIAGCGLALLPHISVTGEIAAGQLRPIRLHGLHPRRPLRVQWLAARPLSAAAAAFQTLLTSVPS